MIYVYYNDDTFQEIAQALHQAIDSKLHLPAQLVKRIDPIQATHNNLFIMLGLNNETPVIPPIYIAYQFEQTGNANSWFTETYLSKLSGAIEIWDYSIVNIQNLKKTYPDLPPIRYAPLGYSPVLQQIVDKATEDKRYDILFYGSACPRRDKIIRSLRGAGFRVYYGEFSCWDEDRNRMIADSKIVLNIHYYPRPILETTRISFLVANSAFVITEPSLDPILDKEYRDYAVFAETDQLVETCRYYLQNQEARDRFARQAHLNFISKDYSKVIPAKILTTYEKLEQQTIKKPLSPETRRHRNATQERRGLIRPKFHPAEVEITSDGAAILKSGGNQLTSENCPMVTLVTPTANRTWSLLSLALRCFYRFDYPRDKLEWIILDSNPSGPVNIPPDPRIQYKVVDNSIPLWKKRNMCNELATGEVIIHLDDDDYYFETSIWAKVKLLAKYSSLPDSDPRSNIKCVGCTELGIYHLLDNYSYLASTKYISEASMAYYKSFWEKRKFSGDDLEMGEGYAFVKGRESQVVTLPYYFNFIALTHDQNYTGKLRTFKDQSGKAHDNFFNVWDRETQYFFLELRQKCLSSRK